MHVVISGMFRDQPTVGSGQYLHGLLEALPRVAPEHTYTLLLPAYRTDHRPPTTDHRPEALSSVVVVRTPFEPPTTDCRPEALSSVVSRPSSVVVVRTPFDGGNANLSKLWFEQIGAPLAAARLGADLLHVPYFAPPLVSAVPVVVSILDIIPLLLPEYRGSIAVRAYMRLAALAARRAAWVLTLSERSRADIVARLGIPGQRVRVTPLAAGAQYRPLDHARAAACVAEHYGLREPFVYYVGGLDARKNVATLLRAFGRLRRAGGPAATLAIAGRALGTDQQLFPDLDALIAAERLEPWVRRIDVPYEDNPLLYAAATAFAYPSRYEGFGLPALEALACGTPALVADASSLPAVVGDAALRVPPDDVDGWTTALWRLLGDAALRADLRRRGLERAARFSYEQVARDTIEVYAKVRGRG
ncbi:MAG: glycosyltransferase family 4 protein [Roseiflexaceae bacterium]